MHVLLVWIVYAAVVLYCTQISVAQLDDNECDIKGAVRLVGGASELEGQVEECTPNMTWTPVCSEDFSDETCKMLGYSRFNATAFPEPRRPEQHLNISCESARRVQCQPRICENGDVRLVGGQSDLEGLLEVCFGEVWSTVKWCDYWNSSEASASVVCRQMNYSRFALVIHHSGASASSESSNGEPHTLKCMGNESKIFECNTGDTSNQSCSQSNRVRVHCQPHCAFCKATAATSPPSFNCDAVGGTLGTLVIVLVFLLAGVTASLVYFIVKLKCNSREEHQEDPDVPDERTLHNPVYACGSEALSPHNRKIDTVIPSQYSCVGPENTGVTISQSGNKVHYIK